jgi:hypothetical protein
MGSNYYSWNTSFCVGFNPKIWAPTKFEEKLIIEIQELLILKAYSSSN